MKYSAALLALLGAANATTWKLVSVFSDATCTKIASFEADSTFTGTCTANATCAAQGAGSNYQTVACGDEYTKAIKTAYKGGKKFLMAEGYATGVNDCSGSVTKVYSFADGACTVTSGSTSAKYTIGSDNTVKKDTFSGLTCAGTATAANENIEIAACNTVFKMKTSVGTGDAADAAASGATQLIAAYAGVFAGLVLALF